MVNVSQKFGLLCHAKKIASRPAFLWSPLTFYQFSLSLNSIHQQCDNEPSVLRQSTYLCKLTNNSITNIEINSLGAFNAKFPTLSHIRLTLYSTGDDQGGWKTHRFTAVVHHPSQWQMNWQTPGILMLTSYLFLMILLFWGDSIRCMKLFWVWI